MGCAWVGNHKLPTGGSDEQPPDTSQLGRQRLAHDRDAQVIQHRPRPVGVSPDAPLAPGFDLGEIHVGEMARSLAPIQHDGPPVLTVRPDSVWNY